jgi:hypothetical protein
VEEREALLRAERRNDVLHLVLLPLYPFLGLCWAEFKTTKLAMVGFDPTSITKASLAVTLNLAIVEGILLGWLMHAGEGVVTLALRRPSLLWMDWLLLVLCSLDTVIRYSGSLHSEAEYHLGFCEWLWPKMRK